MGDANGVSAEKYFKVYSMLVEDLKEVLPHVKIVILEPFVLKGSGTEWKWEEFHAEVLKRAKMAKAVADNDFWLMDGVHPTATGHELIKREWLKRKEEILGSF